MSDDNERRTMNTIRTFGNRYIKDSFIKPKPVEPMVYDKNHLCIGKKVETGQPYYLDLSEACRIIMVGATRSGKSFAMRSMMDRLALLDYDILSLLDAKDEFRSSTKPVQSKFRHLLFPNEKPRATKVVTLRPTFFKTIGDYLPEDNFWYSPDVSKMTKNDFMTLMNVGQMTGPQKVIMEMIFEKMTMMFQSNPSLKFSVELIEDCIDDIEDINAQQALSMKFKFRPLKSSHFYDGEYERNIIALMQKGFIPSLNMENFDSFGEGSFAYPDVVLSMVLRLVIQARIKGLLRPVFVFFDECPRFIGRDKHTSIKNQVRESVMLHTAKRIYYVFATQDYNIMPEDIRSNTKYVFLPRSCNVEDIKNALNDTGMSRNIHSAKNDAIKLKKRMKKAPYSWLVIDKMNSNMDIITFSAPLSNHMETTN